MQQDKLTLNSTIYFPGCSLRQKAIESTLSVYFSSLPVQTEALLTQSHTAVCLSG